MTNSRRRWSVLPAEGLLGAFYLLAVPLALLGLGQLLSATGDGAWTLLLRLTLVFGAVWLGLRLLQGSTALAFGLASLVALLVFGQPLGFYTEHLFEQASDLTVFIIVLFGAVLVLVGRQDLLDRQAARQHLGQTADPTEHDRDLDREVAVFCLLRQISSGVQGLTSSRLGRGLLLLPLALFNFVSSVPSVLLFKSLWVRPGADLVGDPAARSQAAGILCLCTSGVLLVLSSTWWVFFNNMAKGDWTPTPPLGVWLYGLLSYAHGYWLLTRHGEPRLAPVDAGTRQVRRVYWTLLAAAVAAVALTFGALAWTTPGARPAAATQSSTIALAVPTHEVQKADCQSTAIPELGDKRKSPPCKPPDPKRLAVCTLLVGLTIALLTAQGWIYRFHLRPSDERWSPSRFWRLMLEGMRGVFSTVVLLVVILAFKDLVKILLEAAPIEIGVPKPFDLLVAPAAVAITAVIGMALGSSWGAFALGFLLVQMTGGDASPALTQALILVATFCNQRSPSADNVLNLLGGGVSNAANLRRIWSTPSLTLRLAGRSVEVQAQWAQIALVGLAILVALLEQWMV